MESLRDELRSADHDRANNEFTRLFQRGRAILNLDDESTARLFDASRPNARRWTNGESVPPAAAIVLGFLADEIDAELEKIR